MTTKKRHGGKAGDYEVGYGKPPVEHRFKEGQSGNPKGRPKGAKNLATAFKEALGQRVAVRVGDKTRWMTLGEAAFYAQALKAAKGDPRAFANTLAAAKAAGLFTPESTGGQDCGVLVVPAQLSLDEWMAKYGKKDDDKNGE